MYRLEPKHPRAIRWAHWVNVPVLAVMIWSGLLIYWANDVYEIGAFGVPLFHFFPDWFYSALGLEQRLALGMAYHFTFMWVFALNGICYVLYTFFSGEWRHLLPNRNTPGEAWQVVLHDLGLRKKPLPPGKFNGAQRLAYTGVVLMGAGSLLTGLAIYKPTQLAWLTALLGGYSWARAEHFALTIGYVLFFAVHITQVVRAGWNNFRAMVTGYELVPAKEPDHV
jgi:thiosulfate reductase cytochrome b subunit